MAKEDHERIKKLLSYAKHAQPHETVLQDYPRLELTPLSFQNIYANRLTSSEEKAKKEGELDLALTAAKENFQMITEAHNQMMELHRELESAYNELQKEH